MSIFRLHCWDSPPYGGDVINIMFTVLVPTIWWRVLLRYHDIKLNFTNKNTFDRTTFNPNKYFIFAKIKNHCKNVFS